jgi:hypothetical protein
MMTPLPITKCEEGDYVTGYDPLGEHINNLTIPNLA